MLLFPRQRRGRHRPILQRRQNDTGNIIPNNELGVSQRLPSLIHRVRSTTSAFGFQSAANHDAAEVFDEVATLVGIRIPYIRVN